jgi:hypothetical protein
MEYEASMDFGNKIVKPVRGTNPLPVDLSIEFVEAGK